MTDEHAMYGTQHKSPVFSFFCMRHAVRDAFWREASGIQQANSKPTASHDSKRTATGIKMSEDIESAPALGGLIGNVTRALAHDVP
jgi:hypothetical protein